jgi:hypothetical protein
VSAEYAHYTRDVLTGIIVATRVFRAPGYGVVSGSGLEIYERRQ